MFYPGRIHQLTFHYEGRADCTLLNLCGTTLQKKLLQFPFLEIAIEMRDSNPLVIIPTDEEFQNQILKEHQKKVKPKIQEAVPQLPRGVAGIVAQYCSPEKE